MARATKNETAATSTAKTAPVAAPSHETFVRSLNDMAGTCSSRSVVVIVKPGCPHCESATEKLTAEGVTHTVIPSGALTTAVLQGMATKLGVSTYPRIFMRGRFVGGNSDLQAMTSAEIRGAP